MSLMLVFDPIKGEARRITDCFTDYAAKNLSDEWSAKTAATRAEAEKFTDEPGQVGVLCSDTGAEGISTILSVREKCSQVKVVVIADAATSPLVYMRPSVSASGLLLRPLSDTQVSSMLTEVFEEIRIQERQRLFGQEVFSIDTREEIIRIPYSKILYFEARAKRIVLCTGTREYSFYDTLEGLSERIPDYFIRCHKGFIVNRLLVEKLRLSENVIQMFGGFQVPVSRSYKPAVKEAVI